MSQPDQGLTSIEGAHASQQAAGDDRPQLGMVGRVKLAQRVAVARAQAPPVGWDDLAEQEGYSRRQLQRILADYEQESLELGDGLGIIRETLGLFNSSIQLLADIAEADTTHSTVKTGATRLLLEALGARIQLLVASGLMPRRLSAQKDHDDALTLISKMARVVERHNLGAEVIDELLQVVGAEPAQLEAGDP